MFSIFIMNQKTCLFLFSEYKNFQKSEANTVKGPPLQINRLLRGMIIVVSH